MRKEKNLGPKYQSWKGVKCSKQAATRKSNYKFI